MKYILLLFTTCGILLVSNCKKEIDYPAGPIHFAGDQEYGWSIAIKNGLNFEASGYAKQDRDRPDDFFGLRFLTYTDWGAEREFMSVGELEYKTGRRQVVREDDNLENGIPIGSYSTLSDDGDVLEDFYRIDSRQDNWIEITVLDTINGELTISGSYSLHFKIDREKTNPLNPDHIRFLDGVFEVRFQQ